MIRCLDQIIEANMNDRSTSDELVSIARINILNVVVNRTVDT